MSIERSERSSAGPMEELPQEVKEQLAAYGPPPPSPSAIDDIMAALAAPTEQGRGASRSRSRWPWALGLTAAAAAAIVIGFVLRPERVVQEGELRATERRELLIGGRAMVIGERGALLSYQLMTEGGQESVVVTQRAGSASYYVQPGGPFAVHTPAGVARVTGTAFRVEVSEMTREGKILGGVSAALLVTVAVITGSVIFENEHGQVALAAGELGRAGPSSAPEGLPSLALDEGAATKAPARQPAKRPRRLESPEARQRLLREIAVARERRERRVGPQPGGEPSGGAGEPSPEPRGHLDSEYIRDVVGDSIDLVRECYEMALEEDPNLGGRLVAHFTISGEQDVGGLVEAAEIELADGLAPNETITECMRETVLSFEFPPPEGGGVVEVSYPFIFRNTDEEPEPEN